MTEWEQPPADSVSEDAAKIRLLANIVEHAPIPIFMKDPDGVYLYSNGVNFQLTGSPEVVGKTDHELFPEALAAQHRSEDLAAMESDSLTESTSVVEISGEPRVFKKLKFPIHDGRGEVVGVCGIALDITDSLSEQQARDEQEERATAAKPFERLLATLTPQEAVIAELLIQGFSDHQIAKTIHLEPNTVRHHVSHVLKKLRKQSRTQAVIEMLRFRERN
jgi:PAS domain S-box-containing protein